MNLEAGGKLSLLLFAFFLCVPVQAQDLNAIRKEYQLIKGYISTLEEAGYAGELYCMQVIDNKYGKSKSAVGNYKAETFYYYEEAGGFPPVLRMVIEKVEAASSTTYSETLFDSEGNLLFIFQKTSYDDNIEKRIYFHNGKLFYYTENGKKKSAKLSEELIWIQKAGKAHKIKFDTFFNAE